MIKCIKRHSAKIQSPSVELELMVGCPDLRVSLVYGLEVVAINFRVLPSLVPGSFLRHQIYRLVHLRRLLSFLSSSCLAGMLAS